MAKPVSQRSQRRPDRRPNNWATSKSQGHADMARLKSEPDVEPLRIDAGAMRQELDQLAIFGARLRDGPLHQLLAEAAAAALRGDANVLDQAARGALRAQSRQDAELQAADHRALIVLGDHKLDMGSVFERFERPEIGRRQRLFDPFARAAKRIVRQHAYDGGDVVTPGAPDGYRGY